MDATVIRTSSAGQPYQVVAWTQQWTLRDGRWYRVAQVYSQGRLALWLVPDEA